MKKLIYSAILSSAIISSAWAGGPETPVIDYTAFNGFYIGVGGAYYITNFQVNIASDNQAAFQGSTNLQANSVYFQGQAGYGHAFNRFYLGLNLFADVGQAQDTNTLTAKISGLPLSLDVTSTLKNVYGAALKPGIVVSPKLLIYGLGGFAVGIQDLSIGGVNEIDDTHKSGWLAGVGAEYMVWKKLSVNGEWSYLHFNETSQFLAGLFGEPVDTQETHANRILLGLNYHF